MTAGPLISRQDLLKALDDPFDLGFALPYVSASGALAANTLLAANQGYWTRLMTGATITKIAYWVGTQSGNMSVAAYANSGIGRAAVPGALLGGAGLAGSRAPTDGVTTSGSPTVTSATAAFTAADLGRAISGTGIPANSYIGIVNSATSIGLSSVAGSNTPVNASATGTGITLTIAAGFAVTPNAEAERTLDAAVTVHRGDWLYLGADNNTATFGGVSSGASNPLFTGLGFTKASAFPAPSPAPGSLTATTSRLPLLIGVP